VYRGVAARLIVAAGGAGLELAGDPEQDADGEVDLGDAVGDERHVLEPAHPVLAVDDVHRLEGGT
jgi:hypothetical protein